MTNVIISILSSRKQMPTLRYLSPCMYNRYTQQTKYAPKKCLNSEDMTESYSKSNHLHFHKSTLNEIVKNMPVKSKIDVQPKKTINDRYQLELQLNRYYVQKM